MRPATVEEAISHLVGARGSAGARRGADARQRDEGARGVSGRARRPRRPRGAARDRLLLRRAARDRRDGDVRAARGVLRGRGRAADPRRGRGDDRATSRCGTAAPSAATSASPTRRTTCRRSSPRSTPRSRSAGGDGERTVSADDFFVGVYMTAVGEGELLTKVSVPPSKGAGDGFAGLTIGRHGTYVVDAAATVGDDGVRIALGCVAGGTRARDRDGGEARGRRLLRGGGEERPPRASAPRSTRPPTSTARPSTAATSPRSPPSARCSRRRAGGRA